MPNQEQAREYGHYHSVVFQKSIQKCLSLILRRDQTTWPTKNQKVSVERLCSYFSFGTSRFEIGPPVIDHCGISKIMTHFGRWQKARPVG